MKHIKLKPTTKKKLDISFPEFLKELENISIGYTPTQPTRNKSKLGLAVANCDCKPLFKLGELLPKGL